MLYYFCRDFSYVLETLDFRFDGLLGFQCKSHFRFWLGHLRADEYLYIYLGERQPRPFFIDSEFECSAPLARLKSAHPTPGPRRTQLCCTQLSCRAEQHKSKHYFPIGIGLWAMSSSPVALLPPALRRTTSIFRLHLHLL